MTPATRIGGPLVMAAWVLAGCGGGTKTVIVQGPPSTQSTARQAAAGVTTPSSGTSTGSADAPPSTVVRLQIFRSPTGNIGCALLGAVARCDILRRTWPVPARPSTCPPIVDYGQGLEVGPGGAARFVCAGDTARDPLSPRLAYGAASRVGPFVCVSRRTGMTCTSSVSGHGFLLSVQRYTFF
jgi:hypothetical protein